MGGEAPELEENKKPRHHVEAFEVFECFSSLCFLCSYDLYLWKSVFLSGCKINNKIDSNQKKSSFLRKKERKRLQVLPPQQGSFCNKKSKNIRFYFVLSAFYSIFAPNYI